MSHESPTQPLPPFDDPDADIIIRSCDGVKWTSVYAQIAYDSALVAQPVYAYFLACLCGQEDKARLAARYCLHIPVLTMVGTSLRGLEGLVPLETLQRLVQYRLASQEVAVELVRSWEWMIPVPKLSDQFWLQPNKCCYPKTISEHKDPSGASHKVQEWWALFMRSTREKLEKSTHKDAVEFLEAMKIFATKGPMCDTCRSCADRSISAFTGWLSEKVEKTLNMVVLDYSES